MANWALVIGVNKYDRLRSLDYAERDAALMRDFFQNEGRFDQIFYFSDTSPDFYAPDNSHQSTRPTYANLRSFLRDFFEESYLQAGDNFWFFFSGHGIRHQDRDYLMPCDANPRDVEYTAISISYVTERLRRCGADNVVLLLDACRNEGEKAGLGIGGEKQQGVITICSCSPKEKSYEIEQIGQGAFTYALIESLRIQGEGNCATVERLYQRLCYRVAEINRFYNKPEQSPYAIAEPASKYHLILLPRQATLQDIAELKMDAFKAEVGGDYELAKQLWIRINAATAGADIDMIPALHRIFQRQGQPAPPAQPEPVTTQSGAKSQATPLKITEPEVELLSKKNLDYTKLKIFLALGTWKEADEETIAVLFKAAAQKHKGHLDIESIEKFPCADLRTIDRLWVKYSNGRFGFSVQKRIWENVVRESVGLKPSEYYYGMEFPDRVGWSVKGEWLDESELTYGENAPEGHLPSYCLLDGYGWEFKRRTISSLALRLVSCNI